MAKTYLSIIFKKIEVNEENIDKEIEEIIKNKKI